MAATFLSREGAAVAVVEAIFRLLYGYVSVYVSILNLSLKTGLSRLGRDSHSILYAPIFEMSDSLSRSRLDQADFAEIVEYTSPQLMTERAQKTGRLRNHIATVVLRYRSIRYSMCQAVKM